MLISACGWMNEIKYLWICHKATMSLFSGSNNISWSFQPTCLVNDTVFTIILNIQKNVHNYFLKIHQIQSLSRFLNCLAGALLSSAQCRIWALSACTLSLGILSCPNSFPNSICLFMVPLWKCLSSKGRTLLISKKMLCLCQSKCLALDKGILSEHSGSCLALPSNMLLNLCV